MAKHQNIRLDSAELSALWTNYLADSASFCILNQFQQHCDDSEIKRILRFAIELSENHLKFIDAFFAKEGVPVPSGFTQKEDINSKAPRLFSDAFYLFYLENMTTMGLATYSDFLSGSTQEEIRKYATKCVTNTMELFNQTVQLLSEKGLKVRPPYLSYPEKGIYVDSKQFLAGWWGKQRPLTAVEVANLFVNLHTSSIDRALLMAFTQTAKSETVKKFLIRGKAFAEKHIEIYSEFLKESDLPAPVSWDNGVQESNEWAFSERLMMFQIAILGQRTLSNCGISVALSQRRDLAVDFVRLGIEMIKYLGEGAKIMIENHWMEMPPSAVQRES